MEKWMVSAKKADFAAWAEEFHVSPVLARIIRNRDVTEPQQVKRYLKGTLGDCYSPRLLRHMDKAVEMIAKSIRLGERIRVIGDYDVDGICSSYILTRGLELLGAQVDTAIPHRIKDGYGLNEQLIEAAREDGVRLIITCDNGISAYDQIALAKEYGIKVVITDHHEVPFAEKVEGREEKLPPADAIVDPKQEKCEYPFPNICGAVVAYKLVQALAESMIFVPGERDRVKLSVELQPGTDMAKRQQELSELVQFAAIATVCDVMELRDENRIIVKEGLKRLRCTGNPGLQALLAVNEIAPQSLSAYHLGFVIGPCLNATGRLDTARRALELLMAKEKREAMEAAADLKALNDSRKNLTAQGLSRAYEYIEQKGLEQERVLVVYLPEVHESLAGIIAGRIREKYNRPAIVLTAGEEGVKGSGRSIDTYHMYENLTKVEHCFGRFGGHKLAAGFTLARRYPTEAEDAAQFYRELLDACTLTEEDLVPVVHIDVPMPLSYPTLELAEELELLEPFGMGNPRPLFAQKGLALERAWRFGNDGRHARYLVRTPEGVRAELTYFNGAEDFEHFMADKFGSDSVALMYAGGCSYPLSVTYQLKKNSYRGQENLQFLLQNYC